jgi:hypothetical protein
MTRRSRVTPAPLPLYGWIGRPGGIEAYAATFRTRRVTATVTLAVLLLERVADRLQDRVLLVPNAAAVFRPPSPGPWGRIKSGPA